MNNPDFEHLKKIEQKKKKNTQTQHAKKARYARQKNKFNRFRTDIYVGYNILQVFGYLW